VGAVRVWRGCLAMMRVAANLNLVQGDHSASRRGQQPGWNPHAYLFSWVMMSLIRATGCHVASPAMKKVPPNEAHDRHYLGCVVRMMVKTQEPGHR